RGGCRVVWFQRHGLVVVEERGADGVELGGGLGAADLMQEWGGDAFAEIVEELLHALALRLLGLVEGRLGVPEGANVAPHVATGGLCHGLAAQLLADLVEQPRAADRAAANHQAATPG